MTKIKKCSKCAIFVYLHHKTDKSQRSFYDLSILRTLTELSLSTLSVKLWPNSQINSCCDNNDIFSVHNGGSPSLVISIIVEITHFSIDIMKKVASGFG